MGAIAVGALTLLGFGTQQAEALTTNDFDFCQAGDGGCTPLSTLTDGTWLGNIHNAGDSTALNGEPKYEDIVDFKIGVGEIASATEVVDLGKIDGVDNSPVFDVDGPLSTTGTITYTGGGLAFANIALKFNAKPMEIWRVEDLKNGDTFDYTTTAGQNALSNVQFVGAVPIPGAVWLFGTALAGLGVFARRKIAA
jgi:hypothetical protein